MNIIFLVIGGTIGWFSGYAAGKAVTRARIARITSLMINHTIDEINQEIVAANKKRPSRKARGKNR